MIIPSTPNKEDLEQSMKMKDAKVPTRQKITKNIVYFANLVLQRQQ